MVEILEEKTMIQNAEAKFINGLKLGLCNTMTSYPGAGATKILSNQNQSNIISLTLLN